MKLSALSAKVLREVELRADLAATEIASVLQVSPQKVYYELNRLRDLGLLQSTVRLLNPRGLGFREYCVYLSFRASAESMRSKVHGFLKACEHVTWFSEVGGQFQFAILLHVTHAEQVIKFQTDLTSTTQAQIQRKAVTERISFHIFSREGATPVTLTARPAYNATSLSRSRLRTLNELVQEGPRSNRDIARTLGVSPGVVDKTLTELQNENVIYGNIWLVDHHLLGLTKFKAFISVARQSEEFCKKLHEFCELTPNITHLAECIGQWDFEISLLAKEARETAAVVGVLFEKFHANIADIETIPVYQYLYIDPSSPLRLLKA